MTADYLRVGAGSDPHRARAWPAPGHPASFNRACAAARFDAARSSRVAYANASEFSIE